MFQLVYCDKDDEVRTPAVQVQLPGVCVELEVVTPLDHRVAEAGSLVELHHLPYPTEPFVGQGKPGAVMGTGEVELGSEIEVELI